MHLKLSSGKWRPSCLGLNVLMNFSKMAAICSGPNMFLKSHFQLEHNMISSHTCHANPTMHQCHIIMYQFVTEMWKFLWQYGTLWDILLQKCAHMHISATQWCIVGYLWDALWDLWEGAIGNALRITSPFWPKMRCVKCEFICLRELYGNGYS